MLDLCAHISKRHQDRHRVVPVSIIDRLSAERLTPIALLYPQRYYTLKSSLNRSLIGYRTT